MSGPGLFFAVTGVLLLAVWVRAWRREARLHDEAYQAHRDGTLFPPDPRERAPWDA